MSGAPALERRIGPADEARAVIEAVARGTAIAVVTVIDGDSAGARLLLDETGARGDLGDALLERSARDAAGEALRAITHEPETGTLQSERGLVRALIEVHRAAPRLFVVGAGHIAVPLARVAGIAGFDVTVLDDREEFAQPARFDDRTRVLRMDPADPFALGRPDEHTFVVLVTRAHQYDYECLRRILVTEPLPRYLGMIGSRRRVRAAFGALLEEGVPRARVARVHAPLGLDIGAETPEEIAISVVAEMVAVRRSAYTRDDAGAPLSTREAVLDRFFPPEQT